MGEKRRPWGETSSTRRKRVLGLRMIVVLYSHISFASLGHPNRKEGRKIQLANNSKNSGGGNFFKRE